MANKIYFLILQFAFILNNQCNCQAMGGYYWKNYKGLIPSDAIEAGVASNGEILYIGQTPHLNNVIVGQLHQRDQTLHYEYYGLQTTKKNIKIFCSSSPQHFVWVPTDIGKLEVLNEKYLVPGGSEPNRILYIGRKSYNSQVLVGKVVKNRGLYISHNNQEKQKFREFEILTYQPGAVKNVESVTVSTISD